MVNYDYTFPASVGGWKDLFNGASSTGTWQVTLWGTNCKIVADDSTTTGFTVPDGGEGNGSITFTLKDQSLWLYGANSAANVHVLILPVVPTIITTCS